MDPRVRQEVQVQQVFLEKQEQLEPLELQVREEQLEKLG
jgi:hypothetical protein